MRRGNVWSNAVRSSRIRESVAAPPETTRSIDCKRSVKRGCRTTALTCGAPFFVYMLPLPFPHKTMHGQFSWYDLMTPDAGPATRFYPAVVGWGTEEWDQGKYTMWTAGGVPFAGINPISAE